MSPKKIKKHPPRLLFARFCCPGSRLLIESLIYAQNTQKSLLTLLLLLLDCCVSPFCSLMRPKKIGGWSYCCLTAACCCGCCSGVKLHFFTHIFWWVQHWRVQHLVSSAFAHWSGGTHQNWTRQRWTRQWKKCPTVFPSLFWVGNKAFNRDTVIYPPFRDFGSPLIFGEFSIGEFSFGEFRPYRQTDTTHNNG